MKPFKHGCGGDPLHATQILVRRMPFVELVELLEFSHLRLEAPTRAGKSALIGTQDWHRQITGNTPDVSDVYLCTTLKAMNEAVFTPENVELKIGMPSRGKIRLQAFLRQKERPAPPPCLRVDLQALIRRVLVPKGAPAHLYDLVRHVVTTRLWIEVTRV